jgi:hypothetical protein
MTVHPALARSVDEAKYSLQGQTVFEEGNDRALSKIWLAKIQNCVDVQRCKPVSSSFH